MKINIQKFQSGGKSRYFSTDPLASTQASASTSNSGGGSDDDLELLNNQILNAITSSEMPNEVAIFEQAYADLMMKAKQNMDVTQELASLRTMMSSIIANSKTLDRAETRATNNKSMDDVAIDGKGSIYAMTEKGIVERIPFKQFNHSKHQALTYGELIQLRRVRPELVNDQTAIFSIGNSVGTETISSFIMDVLDKIGKATSKQDAIIALETLFKKKVNMSQADYLALGDLAKLADHIGLDAMFNTTQVSSNKNLQQAFDYLLKMLPQNMEMQLIGSYIGAGGTYKDALKQKGEVIGSALAMINDSNEELTGVELNDDLNQALGNKAGRMSKTKEKEFNLNMLETWILGMRPESFTISDPNAKHQYSLTVKGSVMSQLTTTNNSRVSNTPMSVALNASIGMLLDSSIAYIGEKRVSEAALANVVYTSDKVAKAEMPITEKGKINWAGFHGASKAEEYIKNNNIKDINQKNDIHRDFGSFMKYNEKGELVPINPRMTETYVITFGYTTEDIAEDGNTLGEKVPKDQKEAMHQVITAAYASTSSKTGITEMAGRKNRHDLYKVPIFVKLDDHAALNALTYSGHGAQADQRDMEDDMLTEQLSAPVTQQNWINGNGANLWE